MLSKYDEIRAKRARGDKGFTLIELLVVVVIIGILIAIAIPVYLNYQKSSHDKATGSDVRNAVIALENCYTTYNEYPASTSWDSSTDTVVSLCGGTSDDDGTDGGQSINLSTGTKIKYDLDSDTFTLCGHNSSGSEDAYFHYDSANGSSVEQQTEDCMS